MNARRKPRSLGGAVRAARRQLDLTQQQLADKAKVVPTYVTAIECNRRSSVSVEKLHQVATALGYRLELVEADDAVIPLHLSKKTLSILDKFEKAGVHGVGRESVVEGLLYKALQAELGEGAR